MKPSNHRMSAPAGIGFLVDELRLAGVTAFADLAASLNAQGIRPPRGRWQAHDLYLVMRRYRRAHPAARLNVGAKLQGRRAEDARRVINRLRRRGFRTHAMIAKALNARGSTTPGRGRPWTARTVSRVLARSGHRRRGSARRARSRWR